jgi:hypothetical protein
VPRASRASRQTDGSGNVKVKVNVDGKNGDLLGRRCPLFSLKRMSREEWDEWTRG